MDWKLVLEFLVLAGALAMGARMGGVGLGLWGAVGLLVLVVGFDVAPANSKKTCSPKPSSMTSSNPRT
jgi:anaerobic C4-dicarboxylate transporter DcuA